MTVLFRCQFGSHLYGTNTPESDLDYKTVVLPSAEQVLLGRAHFNKTQNTKADSTAKNTSDDVDNETFSIGEYLKLLQQGQTVALDMLFAMQYPAVVQEVHPLWEELYRNRHRLLSKNAKSFIGYCFSQSAKYGVKGSRMGAVERMLRVLEGAPDTSLVGECLPGFVTAMEGETYFKVNRVSITPRNGEKPYEQTFMEIVGRKFPVTATIMHTRNAIQKIYNEYGHRARQAKENQGIDWKALSHAIRVCGEATELLETGYITFPLEPSLRRFVLDVKQGKLPFDEVQERLEAMMDRVTEAEQSSMLPNEPDREWIQYWLLNAHRNVVLEDWEMTCSG